MELQIYVEQQAQNKFVATVLGWPTCAASGCTKQEAIESACAIVNERLKLREVVTVQVGEASQFDPWLAMAGRFSHDPSWDEYQIELRRIRENANNA